MNSARASVLVVDDEKLIRWSVGERLTRNGYAVESAESGEQALEKLVAGAFDVMLLDVRLPGIDGIVTLRRALNLRPNLVVVMMSAHGTVDIAVGAMKEGSVDFLVKPFPLSQLDAAVEKALTVAATRRSIATPGSTEGANPIIGTSRAIAEVREVLDRLAVSNATTVLIEGESGAGKEIVARAVHFQSSRADKPFLQLNCAALPEQLLESELFGHERGAFTDAHSQKRGLFENAGGGSAMLDEIGDMPPGGQAKLLRLLENKTFRRLGGVTELHADVRVIAVTNANLEERVREGAFRSDLFFRLNVIRIRVPPLRERVEDIPDLAAFFISRFNKEMGGAVRGVSAPALELMNQYAWPGNVRELRNVVERSFILHPGIEELRPEHLPAQMNAAVSAEVTPPPALAMHRDAAPSPEGATEMSLSAQERKLIAEAMEKAHGNQSMAARILGISRDTLRYRLRKHGMQ